MTHEQKQLVIDHLHIAKLLAAHRASRTGLPFDDLYQEGCRLLCVAALHYDGQTASFSTYSRTVLHNGLLNYCAKASKVAGNEILVDDESLETFRIVDRHTADTFRRLEFRDLFQKTRQRYSGTAYWGICALFLAAEGYTFQEISQILHIRGSLLGAMISRAKHKLRNDRQFISDMTDG